MGSSGSQKKMRKLISSATILAPICWSPPKGPLWNLVILKPSSRSRISPVVPVAYTLWCAKRSEEHTSELQSRPHLVCRLLLEKKKKTHLLHVTIATLCAYSAL